MKCSKFDAPLAQFLESFIDPDKRQWLRDVYGIHYYSNLARFGMRALYSILENWNFSLHRRSPVVECFLDEFLLRALPPFYQLAVRRYEMLGIENEWNDERVPFPEYLSAGRATHALR